MDHPHPHTQSPKPNCFAHFKGPQGFPGPPMGPCRKSMRCSNWPDPGLWKGSPVLRTMKKQSSFAQTEGSDKHMNCRWTKGILDAPIQHSKIS